MKRLILAFTMLATPAVLATQALAEGPIWTGIWTSDPEWCQFSDQIYEHDPAPTRITETEVSGLENSCTITNVRGNASQQYWELTLWCSGEGEDYYEDKTLLMMDGKDTLWRWFGGNSPFKFTRCGG